MPYCRIRAVCGYNLLLQAPLKQHARQTERIAKSRSFTHISDDAIISYTLIKRRNKEQKKKKEKIFLEYRIFICGLVGCSGGQSVTTRRQHPLIRWQRLTRIFTLLGEPARLCVCAFDYIHTYIIFIYIYILYVYVYTI